MDCQFLVLERWDGSEIERLGPSIFKHLGALSDNSGFKKSEEWYRRAVARLDHLLGKGHGATLASSGSYGSRLRNEDRDREAESVFRRILPHLEAKQDPGSQLNFVIALENLASSLAGIGRTTEAVDILTRVSFLSLSWTSRTSPANSNLARNFSELEKYYDVLENRGESEFLPQESTAARYLETFGCAHTSLSLGITWINKNQYTKARAHLKAAMEQRWRILQILPWGRVPPESD